MEPVRELIVTKSMSILGIAIPSLDVVVDFNEALRSGNEIIKRVLVLAESGEVVNVFLNLFDRIRLRNSHASVE